MSVVLETTIGDMTIDLFTEERPHCKYWLFSKISHTKFTIFILHTYDHDL